MIVKEFKQPKMLIIIRQIAESNPLFIILFHFGVVDVVERSIDRVINRLVDKYFGIEPFLWWFWWFFTIFWTTFNLNCFFCFSLYTLSTIFSYAIESDEFDFDPKTTSHIELQFLEFLLIAFTHSYCNIPILQYQRKKKTG